MMLEDSDDKILTKEMKRQSLFGEAGDKILAFSCTFQAQALKMSSDDMRFEQSNESKAKFFFSFSLSLILPASLLFYF